MDNNKCFFFEGTGFEPNISHLFTFKIEFLTIGFFDKIINLNLLLTSVYKKNVLLCIPKKVIKDNNNKS